jgi:hypothetical protein
MELRFDHTLACELTRAESALLDPAFAPALARRCPELVEARVLTYADEGDAVARVTRFRAARSGLGAAFAALPSVTWIERVRWSRAAHAGSFEVAPELPAALRRRVRCDGTYALEAQPDGTTRRHVAGVLSVRAPIVGPVAEARVGAMLRALFDAEAALLVDGIG